MLRYFIEIAYDGTPYHGWQRQPNAVTVQENLETALSTLLRREIALTGAGRTDAGVHARQLFAHFDLKESIDTSQLQFRLNRFLPKEIAVLAIYEVQEDAHARFDATGRSYEYLITTAKDPFQINRSYLVEQPLDYTMMNEGAKLLLGRKDFKCFSRSKTEVKTYFCDIQHALWENQGNMLVFTITADRFLRNMVRAIVGTLMEIGQDKMTLEELQSIILSQDRNQAGPSAPAHGLYLTQVTYPQSIFR
ncbi:tRNA pseudouridine(38-40) synthase TruA [Flavimarina sp. Hel_I_48]|uniref:tRNA pseudouridine(38-40) synthase TruA n=1 Tax=Flavimarina sp. Hel_I_48 TaxID=1392488 RepID=UPI000AE742A0|nr:tRNA pseudouridine(38-40) synthase TruA [Flavimarina sp. Hel_I_48]